jgi:hypothetical protein
MAITVNWDDESKAILVWKFEVPWTWDEFNEGLEKSKAMLATVTSAKMLIIATIGNRTTTPAGPALQNFRAGFTVLRPKVDRFVLVYGSLFARALVATLSRVNMSLRNVIFLASSIEEGRRILSEDYKVRKISA